MKTAISLPDELYTLAETYARQHGLSRSELYQNAVRAYLETHKTSVVREALDQVYGVEAGKLDRATENAQHEILPKEKW
jgi:metal-responsive CopG/Arc/MetJ family transcriptional regulator